MISILFSEVNDDTIATSLGLPEYSYYFVRKGFADVLQELGEVRSVQDPANEVDAIYDQATAKGEPCLFFCFAPPNKAVRDLRCPTVIVFAWEFDTIPQSAMGMTGTEDWVQALRETGQAISLSSHTRDVVKRTLGDDFKIAAIPVPIPDCDRPPAQPEERRVIHISGIVVDTAMYAIGEEHIRPINPLQAFALPPWDGAPITLSFSREADQPVSLCGFYEPEVWGAWSCLSEAWVLLPEMVSGETILDLKFMAYGSNVGKTITVAIGDHPQPLHMDPGVNVKRLTFQVTRPANIVMFSGLDAISIPGRPDPRSMAIGVMHLTLSRPDAVHPDIPVVAHTPSPLPIDIQGVLYTSVLTPRCGRKNWRDMITAFCWALRKSPDATLLIKVSDQHHSHYFSELHRLIAKLQPFRCRIIILDGFLDTADYRRLVAMTDVYVNTSRAEGQCLPLMEYMANGTPAIAPRHTSLLDYVDDDATFPVGGSPELTVWPHDPNEKYSALRQRIDWPTVVFAFEESYRVVTRQPERYAAMSACARKRVADFASTDAVKTKLRSFLTEILQRQPCKS